MKIEDLKIQKSWLKILNTYYMFLDPNLIPFPPLSPGEMQFISQIVRIAHEIQNCAYITSILSFHYFISF